jgi:hypothetical protein
LNALHVVGQLEEIIRTFQRKTFSGTSEQVSAAHLDSGTCQSCKVCVARFLFTIDLWQNRKLIPLHACSVMFDAGNN